MGMGNEMGIPFPWGFNGNGEREWENTVGMEKIPHIPSSPDEDGRPVEPRMQCAMRWHDRVGDRAGAVLAQKFWGYCPISPFVSQSIFSILRNRKHTNFI